METVTTTVEILNESQGNNADFVVILLDLHRLNLLVCRAHKFQVQKYDV